MAARENENKSLTGKLIEFMITVSEIRQTEIKILRIFFHVQKLFKYRWSICRLDRAQGTALGENER